MIFKSYAGIAPHGRIDGVIYYFGIDTLMPLTLTPVAWDNSLFQLDFWDGTNWTDLGLLRLTAGVYPAGDGSLITNVVASSVSPQLTLADLVSPARTGLVIRAPSDPYDCISVKGADGDHILTISSDAFSNLILTIYDAFSDPMVVLDGATGNVTAAGNIQANALIGDGSSLTGLPFQASGGTDALDGAGTQTFTVIGTLPHIVATWIDSAPNGQLYATNTAGVCVVTSTAGAADAGKFFNWMVST